MSLNICVLKFVYFFISQDYQKIYCALKITKKKIVCSILM